MKLEDEDWDLSMRVSKRPRSEEEVSLRSMLVHRLTITMKRVGRRALTRGNISHFCENCDQWFREDGFPEVIQCANCGAVYRMEMAIYEQVEGDPRDE